MRHTKMSNFDALIFVLNKKVLSSYYLALLNREQKRPNKVITFKKTYQTWIFTHFWIELGHNLLHRHELGQKNYFKQIKRSSEIWHLCLHDPGLLIWSSFYMRVKLFLQFLQGARKVELRENKLVSWSKLAGWKKFVSRKSSRGQKKLTQLKKPWKINYKHSKKRPLS